MSERKSKTITSGAIGEIEHGPSKFEQFLDRNQKNLFLFGIILIIAAAVYLVMKGVRENTESEAGSALTNSEDVTSLNDVVSTYSGTPASGSAMVLLAEQQWVAEDKENAIGSLNAFLDEYPKHPALPKAYLLLGQYYSATNNLEAAKTSLNDLIDLADPAYSPVAKLFLAELIVTEQPDEADKLLTEISDLDAETAGNLINVADARKRIIQSPTPPVVEPPKKEVSPSPAAVLEESTAPLLDKAEPQEGAIDNE